MPNHFLQAHLSVVALQREQVLKLVGIPILDQLVLAWWGREREGRVRELAQEGGWVAQLYSPAHCPLLNPCLCCLDACFTLLHTAPAHSPLSLTRREHVVSVGHKGHGHD